MSPLVHEYLQHIHDEIKYLESISTGLTKPEFLRDETLKRAVVRSIEIIGEAVKHIPVDLRNEYSQVPWRAVSGMREWLIHGYFGIDYEIVWDVLLIHIPVLSNTITKMLQREDLK